MRRQLLHDGERAVERQAGLDERRELLGEREEVALAEASGRAEHGPARALGVGRDTDRVVGVLLEPLHDGARVGRLHHAVDGLPAPVGCPVEEDRHRPAQASSWVTRRSSSTVVTPSHAFRQPSSRSVTIPSSIA